MKYPFSPDVLDAIPEELAELFRALELTLLREISKRLMAADQLNEVTVQSIRALRSHGISTEAIKKAIREATGISRQELDSLLEDVIERNQKYYRGLADLAEITVPETLVTKRDIDAIIKQAKDELENITRTMGFVVDSGRTMIKPTQAYKWALDKAAMEIQSGAISYNQAIANATRELADSGLEVISYESGHRDQVDVAVRRAVMTGVNQLNSQYADESLDYLETEYVEVSAHSGARDKDGPLGWENHKKWQGKVYWWKEKSKGKPEYQYPEFEKTCGYGSVTGILGANCRHNYTPFIPGVMERTYTDAELARIDPDDFEYEGKRYTHYEATQQQRAIERAVRKWKRREAAATNPEDKQAAQIRQRLLKQKYKEFSKAANLRMQPERMKAYAPKKGIDNSPVRGIIEGKERNLAMNLRKPRTNVLSEDEIRRLEDERKSIQIPDNVLRYNHGYKTGFRDYDQKIDVRGDVMPDEYGERARDRMSSRAVLAHEYYGHYKNHPSPYDYDDWRDEYYASRNAALNTPNLTGEERRDLMIDAYDRAKEAGVTLEMDKEARRIVYGF